MKKLALILLAACSCGGGDGADEFTAAGVWSGQRWVIEDTCGVGLLNPDDITYTINQPAHGY